MQRCRCGMLFFHYNMLIQEHWRLTNPPHANNNLLLLMIKYPLCSHLGIKSIPDLLLFSLVSGHYCAYLICCRKCSEACKQAEGGNGTESSYATGDRYLTYRATIRVALAVTCRPWPRLPHVSGCPGLGEAGSCPPVCLMGTLVYSGRWYVNWVVSVCVNIWMCPLFSLPISCNT